MENEIGGYSPFGASTVDAGNGRLPIPFQEGLGARSRENSKDFMKSFGSSRFHSVVLGCEGLRVHDHPKPNTPIIMDWIFPATGSTSDKVFGAIKRSPT